MNVKPYALFTVILALPLFILTPTVWADEPLQAQAAPTLGGCPVLPADNIWNTPVDTLPVDTNSAAYIDSIGSADNVHADFGSGVWPPGSTSPIGIPFDTVPFTQTLVAITSFLYASESDPGPYPIPANAQIEGGPSGTGDRHVLILRQGECKLYELYRAFPNGNGTWRADSGAIFDLNSNALRPDTWTSADAAGLPILPGLVRYDEVAAGEINHALRFTAPQTRDSYVWPARHQAGDPGANLPPMGQRFRLKASFVIDNSFSPHAQTILRALKKYGMILADNGSSWYISGAPNPNWDNDVLHELDVVEGSDFEAVNVSSLMISPNSGQARGFTISVTPTTRAIEAGQSATYLLNLSVAGNFSSTVNLSTVSPPSGLLLNLSPTSLTPPGQVTLTLTDTHPGPLTPGLWYSLAVTATSGSFIRNATMNLLVGGTKIYLPIILK